MLIREYSIPVTLLHTQSFTGNEFGFRVFEDEVNIHFATVEDPDMMSAACYQSYQLFQEAPIVGRRGIAIPTCTVVYCCCVLLTLLIWSRTVDLRRVDWRDDLTTELVGLICKSSAAE
jgi:hypothetical protein